MKFETIPPEGETDQEKLLNNILDVFIKYDEKLDEFPWEKILTTFTNVKIKGRKKEHVFDIFIDKSAIKKKEKINDRIKDALEDENYIVARIFNNNKPVSSVELELYRKEILDSTKKLIPTTSLYPSRIIAVTKTSYTNDALEYVKDKKNRISRRSFDLIKQNEDGYKIIWLS